MVGAAAISTVELMKFLDVDGLGQVSRIGLGTWQFGSREWGYGDQYAEGAARDIVQRALALGVTLFTRTMTVESPKDSPMPDGFFRIVNPANIDRYHAAIARELHL